MPGTILLTPVSATLPDGTGSGNWFAQATVLVAASTATPANGPRLTSLAYAFDPTNDEHIMWSFRMPENYSSGGTVFVLSFPLGTQAAQSEVVWKCSLAAITAGATENWIAKGYAALATGSVKQNSANGGNVFSSTITLDTTALNSVAANDYVSLTLGRDADHTMDDATGDQILLEAAFEYTTT